MTQLYNTLEQAKNLTCEEDKLIRKLDKDGKFKVKSNYKLLDISTKTKELWPWKMIWKRKIPHKYRNQISSDSQGRPYVYVDSPSQEKLTRLLNIYLNFSRGNIQTLIFHHNMYVNDNQLNFTAESRNDEGLMRWYKYEEDLWKVDEWWKEAIVVSSSSSSPSTTDHGHYHRFRGRDATHNSFYCELKDKVNGLNMQRLSRVRQALFSLIQLKRLIFIGRLVFHTNFHGHLADLSVMQSNFIRIRALPYVYVDTLSREKLTRILKICLNLSRGNILTLIFHYNLYVDDNQLTYTAKRCPRFKRLAMPAWEKLEKQTICSAFHERKDLESLTMPSLEERAYVIEKIGRSCKKKFELKIMAPCDILFASALVSFLPNLGLGYESTSDDYKILKIDDKSCSEILALKSGSLRLTDKHPIDVQPMLTSIDSLVFVHGAFH
ncbi:hypothetical protein MTR67_013846 [Solanum verrucosum]|uniref:Uncharacterized protein n=1 Tax=Solanum verrucosum TaxID=315347 RepID=A0AAF0QBZ7_SOLVR|nr:hypothetical protein MTR67_013846 [Solanum verrucosum]